MEKKERITVYLPQKLYIDIFERDLDHQFSYLVALLVEEFIRATDARISWAEMPSKTEQREYLYRKVRELFSRAGVSTEPPKPPVQERPKPSVQEKSPPTYMQEPTKEVYAVSKPKSVKEDPPPSPEENSDGDIDILKSLDNLW